MLKHGILGLLNYGEQTGYELMGTFRDSLHYFWTAQTSQIYRELKTLKEKGLVDSRTETQEGRPNKNVFSITEAGRQELLCWLRQEKTEVAGNSPLLMQTFFRGMLPPEENIRFFEAIVADCDEFLRSAGQIFCAAEGYRQYVGDPMQALYWKMTAEFGVMYMQMIRTWAEKCIQEIREVMA